MLLRVGVISLSFSLLLALVVAAVILLRGPEEQATSEPVAVKSESSKPLKSVDREIPSRESADLPIKPEPEPEPTPEPEPIPEPEPVAKPVSAPVPEPEPQPQDSLPVAEEAWPKPDSSEVEEADKPRSYNWVPGAVMALTVDAMGITNAPVMRTASQQALDNGIVHVPETSLPWTNSPHRNVYLAGHRLGWPGTGSRLIFYNLNQLSKGDEVLLKDRRGKRYRYKVAEKLIVNPSDRWVMGQELNRDMVTLQSCTGPNFSKRLIIRADRV
ncbi:MAG: sortase [Rubrobacteraceae bacterium]